jgi:hypothetical protein
MVAASKRNVERKNDQQNAAAILLCMTTKKLASAAILADPFQGGLQDSFINHRIVQIVQRFPQIITSHDQHQADEGRYQSILNGRGALLVM